MQEVSRTLYDGVTHTPLLLVEEACAWAKEDYPRKFMRLVGMCEKAKAKGLKRIKRGDLFFLAAQQGMPITLCKEFRFDNNIWSGLSRYILMFRPSLSDVICPKKADIDTVDLEKVWHERVCDSTFFYAHSWQEAKASIMAKDVSAA